ncbi:MAG: TauD/TfdA family dioxygenase [Pseudomonadota bacterium]|nr:TauD/TfdA family dioxygenase [Pseudomonadota bacterium]
MPLTIEPIEGKVFGAIVTGVSLVDMDDKTFKTLYQAFLEYGFLVLPEQFLSEQQNIEFGKRFGELEFGALPLANQHRNDDGSFSTLVKLDSQRMRTNRGNEAWHTDSTYWPVSSKCAMLSALKVPNVGGQTELADMRAGYASLPTDLQEQIESLSAYHSTEFSQANDLGDFPERDKNSIYHGEAYLRPLVKVHPETGVKNLFIGRHAFGIPGLSRQRSRELLAQLLEHVVAEPTRVYQHQWREGDLLVWDNRALLHRARPYDYSEPRVLIGTRVKGDEASELAYYPNDPKAQAGREALALELDVLRAQRPHGF